ncbi:unnamed protein product [Cyprideis torosa]|uniref:Uncharacterized protein n=1 Tax=Cyprideis torosa TaxID=163714 RepID=A0A7R8W7Y1_9CRUS|nr:unnamed protein product [Cyprideis torosa]CAG0888036.1 unnamed protein product [Cyprideis torosa]
MLSGFNQMLSGSTQMLSGSTQMLSGFTQMLSGFNQMLSGFNQMLPGFKSSTLPLPSVNPAIVTPPSLKAPSLDQSPSPSSQPSTSTGRLSSAIRSFVRGVSSAHSSPATTKRSTGAFSFISGGPSRERGSSAGFWPSAHPRKTNSATWSTDSESSDVLTATDLAWSPPEGMEVDPKGSIGPLSSLDEELDLFGEMGWEEWSSSDPNLVGPLPPQRRSGLSGSSVDGGPPLKTTKKKLLRQLWRMRRPPSSEDEEAVEEAAEELEELDTSSDGIFLPCYHHDSNDNVTTCAERSQKKIRVKKEPLLPFSSQLEGDESCDEEEIVKDPTNAAISRIFPSDRVIGICLPKDLSVLVRRTREEVPEVEPYPPPSLAPLLEALNVAKPASISGVTEVIADDSDAIPTGADPTSLMTTVTTAPTGTTQTKTTAEAKGKLVADLGLEFHCREHCLSDDHSAFEDPMKSLVAGRSLSPSAKLPSTPSISPSPSISSAVSSACVGAEAEEEKPTQRSQLTTQTSHSSRSRRGTTPAADGMHEEDATGRCRIRTEILRLIANMSCSIACKLIEQRLLGLKRKFPTTLGELCLYSDVCVLLSKVHLRLNSRKFVQELLQDVRFSCLLEKPREMFGVNVLPEEPTSPTSQGHSKAGILEGAVGGTETDVPGNADSSPEHEFSQSDVGKTLGMMFGKTKAPASRDQHPVHLTQEGVPSRSVSPAKKQIPNDDKETVPITTAWIWSSVVRPGGADRMARFRRIFLPGKPSGKTVHEIDEVWETSLIFMDAAVSMMAVGVDIESMQTAPWVSAVPLRLGLDIALESTCRSGGRGDLRRWLEEETTGAQFQELWSLIKKNNVFESSMCWGFLEIFLNAACNRRDVDLVPIAQEVFPLHFKATATGKGLSIETVHRMLLLCPMYLEALVFRVLEDPNPENCRLLSLCNTESVANDPALRGRLLFCAAKIFIAIVHEFPHFTSVFVRFINSCDPIAFPQFLQPLVAALLTTQEKEIVAQLHVLFRSQSDLFIKSSLVSQMVPSVRIVIGFGKVN